MEAHPVPQNVTNFEFHLVGDMTLKQFTYLASGLCTAYLLFVFLVDKLPLIIWPLIVIFSLTGVAFAFLPIAERPLDHWVVAFLRAVLSPTRRVWRSKRKDIAKDDPIFHKRLTIYLSAVLPNLTENISLSTVTPISGPKLASISQLAPQTQQIVSRLPISQVPVPIVSPPTPNPSSPPILQRPILQQQVAQAPQQVSPQGYPPLVVARPQAPIENRSQEIKPTTVELNNVELNRMVELAKQAQAIQNQILEAEQRLEEIKTAATQPGSNSASYALKFQEILRDLQALTKKASDTSHQLAVISRTPEIRKNTKITIMPKTIRIQPQQVALTSTQNVLNGIVGDEIGNYLQGVIVVAHNKEGLPVRALKTNKLGQFVAATPLPNGVYMITFEKDNLVFDDIEMMFDGSLIPAIKIAAKRGVDG